MRAAAGEGQFLAYCVEKLDYSLQPRNVQSLPGMCFARSVSVLNRWRSEPPHAYRAAHVLHDATENYPAKSGLLLS